MARYLELKYFPASSFRTSFDQARFGVERFRTQGSTWKIQEMPALVFNSTKHSLLITEINTNDPLSGFSTNLVILANLLLPAIAKRFWTWRPNSVIRLVSPVQEFEQSDNVFRCFSSRSRGGGFSLRWHERDSTVSREIVPWHMQKISEYYSDQIANRTLVSELNLA